MKECTWTTNHDQVFPQAKAALKTVPTLAFFDSNRTTLLSTDTSRQALDSACMAVATSFEVVRSKEKRAQVRKIFVMNIHNLICVWQRGRHLCCIETLTRIRKDQVREQCGKLQTLES